jgi:hypothetical protein
LTTFSDTQFSGKLGDVRWVTLLLSLNFWITPVRANDLCANRFLAAIEEMTFVPDAAANFELHEKMFSENLETLSNEELKKRVQAYVDRQLIDKRFLPGLGGGRRAKKVLGLSRDFRNTVDPSGSKLENYVKTVTSSANNAKIFIIKAKGKPLNPRFVELYSRGMPEALTLQEFEERLRSIPGHKRSN